MAWQLDPTFALQTRISLGPRGAYGWAAACAFLLVWLPDNADRHQAIAKLMGLGSLCTFVALPYAAVHIRLLESRGLIDLHRLSAGSPARCLASLMAGGSWWLLVTGIALIAAGWSEAGMPALIPAASIVQGGALAAIILALPNRSASGGLWLLAVVALGTLFAIAVNRQSIVLFVVSAAAALGIAVIGTRRALRVFEFGVSGAASAKAGERRAARFATTEFAEFVRGMRSIEMKPWMIAAIICTMSALVIVAINRAPPGRRQAPYTAIVYAPILAAAFMTASRGRLERETGGVDRIRMSAANAVRALLELTAGTAGPLLAASLAGALTILALDLRAGVPIVAPAPIFACLLPFIGMAEGLRTPRIGIYVAPAVLASLYIAMNDAPRWWSFVPIAWLPAAIAAATIDRPGTRTLSRGVGYAAIAAVAAWLGAQYHADWKSVSWVAGTLSLLAGLVTSPADRDAGWKPIAIGALIAAIATAVPAYALNFAPMRFNPKYWPAWVAHPAAFATFFGVFSALGLVFGALAARRWHGGLSFAVRAAPLACAWLTWQVAPTLLFREMIRLGNRLHVLADVPIDAGLFAALAAATLTLAVAEARRG